MVKIQFKELKCYTSNYSFMEKQINKEQKKAMTHTKNKK